MLSQSENNNHNNFMANSIGSDQLREVRSLAQGHTARKQWRSFASGAVFVTPYSVTVLLRVESCPPKFIFEVLSPRTSSQM